MFSGDVLRQMWPHGDSRIPGLIETSSEQAAAIFDRYGLRSDLVIAHAMAQFSHECGAGDQVVEDLNYSAQGLMTTWPSRFDAAKAAALAHDPVRIANEVYNGRLGNGPGSDDGWTFRGRGGVQLTGRSGYDGLGKLLGLNLLADPDVVNEPVHFLQCAVAKFALNKCIPYAEADDIEGVTYFLNGGHIGIAERKVWLARWKNALGIPGFGDHDTHWVQLALNRLGADPALIADGSYGALTAMAVKAFQQEKGISADGKVGPLTIEALGRALDELA